MPESTSKAERQRNQLARSKSLRCPCVRVHNGANTKPVSCTKSISWSDSHPEIQLLPSRLEWLPQRSIRLPDSSSPNLTMSLNFLCDCWKKCWGMESVIETMHVYTCTYTHSCIHKSLHLSVYVYTFTHDLLHFSMSANTDLAHLYIVHECR